MLDEIDHKLLIAVAKEGLTNTPTENREHVFSVPNIGLAN